MQSFTTRRKFLKSMVLNLIFFAVLVTPFRGWGLRKLRTKFSKEEIDILLTHRWKTRTQLRELTFFGKKVYLLNQYYYPEFALNESAWFIWNRLKKTSRYSDLLDAMMVEYEVEKERASEDILLTLGTLWKKNLIEING